MARPMPNSLMMRSSSSRKLPKTTTMIAAAAVMTRAVAARPSATDVRLSPVRSPLLPDPGQQEHLVVHRQAEHDGEQHHRHPRLDRAPAAMPVMSLSQPHWNTATTTP